MEKPKEKREPLVPRKSLRSRTPEPVKWALTISALLLVGNLLATRFYNEYKQRQVQADLLAACETQTRRDCELKVLAVPAKEPLDIEDIPDIPQTEIKR